MSIHNDRTLDMYRCGGASEYINHKLIDPETEKWNALFKYIEKELGFDKNKTISGRGELVLMLQNAGYSVTATDAMDAFLYEENKVGIRNIKKFNFLLDDFDEVFSSKVDLIVSWRNPHLDMDDMKKLFNVVYNSLNDNGLFIINFQNSDVHPDADILDNGTKYEYKILEDKKTKEKRFYAYFTKEDIDLLRKNLFDIQEYHNEGGRDKKNWHVLTLKKIKNKGVK